MRGGGEYLRLVKGISTPCKYHDKTSAFTLSEVLITLGIIGIVAALTMPNLISDYREKQTLTQLKKSYSLLSQALTSARSEYGNLNEWQDDSKEFFDSVVYGKLNVVKTCTRPSKCSGLNDSKPPAYVLDNGMVFQTRDRKTNVETPYHQCRASLAQANQGFGIHYGNCAYVLVDLNGSKKPNRAGRDIFEFRVYTDGVLPAGHIHRDSNDGFSECNLNLNQTVPVNSNCTAWALFRENMDYLKCFDKLNYDVGPYSCKEAEEK